MTKHSRIYMSIAALWVGLGLHAYIDGHLAPMAGLIAFGLFTCVVNALGNKETP